eukprot:4428815-Prymnesium_polylepis.2
MQPNLTSMPVICCASRRLCWRLLVVRTALSHGGSFISSVWTDKSASSSSAVLSRALAFARSKTDLSSDFMTKPVVPRSLVAAMHDRLHLQCAGEARHISPRLASTINFCNPLPQATALRLVMHNSMDRLTPFWSLNEMQTADIWLRVTVEAPAWPHSPLSAFDFATSLERRFAERRPADVTTPKSSWAHCDSSRSNLHDG